MRQIVLDTETTGLEVAYNHRIIEIGAVELVNRRPSGRTFHEYVNPEREIDEEARQVHGISAEFLADKPRFAEIADAFVDFVRGAELVIHNASFDVGFLNHELAKIEGQGSIEQVCTVLDSLTLARRMHPGQKNTLDALCRRYGVDNSQREKHGALLDAELLAEVYLLMTGGQVALGLAAADEGAQSASGSTAIRRLPSDRPPLTVLSASEVERASHAAHLERIREQAGKCVWLELESNSG